MKFFRNMKLVQKIGILSLCFFILLTGMGLAGIMQLSKINGNVVELNDSRLVPIVKLDAIKSDIEYIRAEINSLMDTNDDSEKQGIQDEIEARAVSAAESLEEYKNDAGYTEVLENYNVFLTAKDAFIKARGAGTAEQIPSMDSLAQPGEGIVIKQGPPEEMVNMDKGREAVISSLDKVIEKHIADAKETYEESKTSYNRTKYVLASLLVVSLVITFILSLVIIRSIVVPVRRVTDKLKEISQSNGDLTQRIGYKSKDEIGELSGNFDLFVEKLQGIIKEVMVSAEVISASSEQLNSATGSTTKSLEEISNTITEIASSTADGAAVAEEASANIAEAAKFTEATSIATMNTTENSKRVEAAAEEGAEKISEVVSSITDIAASSKEVSIMINQLDESSRRIGDIIQIITGISTQTNLLALNAAIEAARAGEAGKGFNVVAEEIRKLADQSNNAALEISELVKENQYKSAAAVNTVSTVEQKVAAGVNKAAEVGESIQNIINNIQGIVNQIEEIDGANKEQVQGTREMERAISNIASTSSEIAGGTENISASIQEQLSTMTEIESTTEQLLVMAKKLSEMTAGFRV